MNLSSKKMYSTTKIIVHCLLTFNTIVYSGEHIDTTTKHLPIRIQNPDEVPAEFPGTNSSMLVGGENIPVISFSNSTICWPNISKTFWRSIIYFANNKSVSSKNFKKLRARYDELTKNVTDHIVQIIYSVNEISNLLQFNATHEELLANNKDSLKEDSFVKTITVPVLLIVILLLLTYVAFLHRKLQFARYKDVQILVQDELIDP